jgi:hypothetical protein
MAIANTRWPAGHSGVLGEGTGISSLNLEPMAYLVTAGMPLRRGIEVPGGGAEQAAPPAAAPSPGYDLRARVRIVDPPDEILPYHPWAKERRNAIMKDYRHPTPEQIDPQTRGWPNGVPRTNYYTSHDGSVGGPIQILQPEGHVVFFYETHHEFRIVPLDGSPHVGENIKLWLGDSRGRWEGNTLVIDATNHNDSTRFTVVGDFHSDGMRVTERWTFVDQDTIEYEATIDDPKVYTKPWTIAVTHTRAPAGTEIMEYAGVEGETGVAEAQAIERARTAEGKQ